jgi:WD40 repeat protein
MNRILFALTTVSLLMLVGVSALWAQGATATQEMLASQSDVRTISVDSKASMVRLSPDDHTLAVYNNAIIYDEAPSADLIVITLMDMQTGKTIGTLGGYSDWVTDAAFNSNGSKLATFHRNGDLILWDVAAKKMIKTIQTYTIGGSWLQFLSDDKTILFRAGEFVIGTLDTESGAITHLYGRHIDTYQEFSDTYTQFPGRGDISFAAAAASPDSHWLLTSTQNDEVIRWDMQTGKMDTLRHPSEHYGLFSIRNLVFSPDGKQFAYFDQSDKKMHVWDIARKVEQGTYDGGGASFAISPDGNHLAWGDRATSSIYLVDASTSDAPTKLVALPETQQVAPTVTSLAFTSDGKQLVVGGLFADEGENQIYIINLAS